MMVAAGAMIATCAGAGVAWSAPAAPSVNLPLPVVNPTIPPNRAVEPVVMTGADFPGVAVPENETAKAPFTDLLSCEPGANTDDCNHNEYSPPQVDTSGAQNQLPIKGVYPDQLLGYRWNPHSGKFIQIPFQVDKVFTRYLENDASGFAIYSGADQTTTYQWQQEGFRNYPDPNDPCHALYHPAAKDPIPYFDTNDEVSFMDSDSGPQAPSGAPLPRGITAMRAVQITDPLRPGSAPSFVYVMVAAPNGPKPAYDASNGYVRYLADSPGSATPANEYVFSQSDYSNYGNAPKGDICGPPSTGHPYGTPILGSDGKPVIARHRPEDTATVLTPRYRFRYDGRWLMTGISISPNDRGFSRANYGPNLVDRWKARAFAQDPSSKTPCCGFEEEDTHWGGSSTLMGELVGPRPGDPGHLGSRLRHQRRADGDLLRRPGPSEVVAPRPRDPAAGRHLRPVGLPCRADDQVLQPQRPEWRGRRRPQRHGVREPGRPLQPQLRRHERGHRHSGHRDPARRYRPQPDLPAALSGHGHLHLRLALPPVDQRGRPHLREPQRLAAVE